MAFTGTTDATGKVTIAVPAGTFTVDDPTVPAGFTKAPAQTGVAVAAGASVALQFQVTAPTGSLVVTVVDQFGKSVPGVVISAA
jgi:hypothetical protein